jgi:hypothetical protein
MAVMGAVYVIRPVEGGAAFTDTVAGVRPPAITRFLDPAGLRIRPASFGLTADPFSREDPGRTMESEVAAIDRIETAMPASRG